MSEILWSILFLMVLLAVLIFILDWLRKRTHKRLIKNYDASEDLSKQGREVGEGKPSPEKRVSPITRQDRTKGKGLLPSTTSSSVGESKPRPKKTGGFLNKLRGRKSKSK